MEKGDLKTIYRQRQVTVTVKELLSHLCDIVSGLHFLHTANITHGDVKLGNVLRGPDGTLKLADFGLAGFEGGAEAETYPYTQEMTPPEFSDTGFTKETDIWQFGIMLSEMLYRLEDPVSPVLTKLANDCTLPADTRPTSLDVKKLLVDVCMPEALFNELKGISPVGRVACLQQHFAEFAKLHCLSGVSEEEARSFVEETNSLIDILDLGDDAGMMAMAKRWIAVEDLVAEHSKYWRDFLVGLYEVEMVQAHFAPHSQAGRAFSAFYIDCRQDLGEKVGLIHVCYVNDGSKRQDELQEQDVLDEDHCMLYEMPENTFVTSAAFHNYMQNDPGTQTLLVMKKNSCRSQLKNRPPKFDQGHRSRYSRPVAQSPVVG
mmetsp:Transcript_26275/g.51818  ORF Transcript_26275/g.51818 Transcript_26275/m.51818 type:complete len:374 (-) Transcript_26275:50-1171(-)